MTSTARGLFALRAKRKSRERLQQSFLHNPQNSPPSLGQKGKLLSSRLGTLLTVSLPAIFLLYTYLEPYVTVVFVPDTLLLYLCMTVRG